MGLVVLMAGPWLLTTDNRPALFLAVSAGPVSKS